MDSTTNEQMQASLADFTNGLSHPTGDEVAIAYPEKVIEALQAPDEISGAGRPMANGFHLPAGHQPHTASSPGELTNESTDSLATDQNILDIEIQTQMPRFETVPPHLNASFSGLSVSQAPKYKVQILESDLSYNGDPFSEHSEDSITSRKDANERVLYEFQAHVVGRLIRGDDWVEHEGFAAPNEVCFDVDADGCLSLGFSKDNDTYNFLAVAIKMGSD